MDLGADKAAMNSKEETEVVMVEVKAVITIKVNKVEDVGAMTEVEVRVAEAEMAVNRLVYKQNVIL
jgi:hypothetical protein